MANTPIATDGFSDSPIGIRGERWTKVTRYWPTLLWNNGPETLSGFNLVPAWAALHDGYLSSNSVAASSRYPTSSTRAHGFFTLRTDKRTNYSVEATFKAFKLSGGDFYHSKATWCTIGARIQGETETQFWNAAGHDEALNAPSGYYFSMASRWIGAFGTSIGFTIYKVTGPSASGGNSTIEMLNDGPSTSPISPAVKENWYQHFAEEYLDDGPDHKLRFDVYDEAGAVILKGYWTNPSTGVEELVAEEFDYSGAITGQGHAGFGMTSEMQDSGSEWIHGIKDFQVKEFADKDTVLFRDEFARTHTHTFQRFSDLIGTDCRMISGSFTGDQSGISQSGETLSFQDRLVRNATKEQLEADGSPGGGWHLDTMPASNIYVQSCSANLEMGVTGSGATSREFGLGVRMDIDTAGWESLTAASGKTGYALGISLSPAGTWVARIYRFEAGGTRTIIAARLLNASGDEFVAAVSVPFDVRMDVQNINGSSQTNGDVKLSVTFDGVWLDGWTMAGDTTEESDHFLDASADAVLSGSAIGFYSDTNGPSSALVNEFTRNPVVYEQDQRDDQGILLPVEKSNRSDDTFSFNHEWPVRVAYVTYASVMDLVSEHEHRHSEAADMRRVWTCGSRAATKAEIDTITSFFRNHEGLGQGFNWVTLEGEAVIVTFNADTISISKVSADVYSFSFQLIELLGPALPVASFEMFGESVVPSSLGGILIVDYPAGAPRHPVFFFQDDDTSFDVTILLAEAATRDVKVAYSISGTAVEGTHYSIPAASASPVTITAGQTSKTISFNILNTGKYHTEKLMVIQMLEGQSETPIDKDNDELHAYIRSTTAPPLVEFSTTSSSPSAGDLHTVQVDKLSGASHADDILLYFKIDPTSTAVEGTDYDLVPNPTALHGLYGIPVANNNRKLFIQILLGATSGRTIKLDLYHEREGELDKNDWTHTDSFELDVADGSDAPLFPTEPADHAPGPASLLPPHPLTPGLDPVLTDLLGNPATTLKLRLDARGCGYHRKDSDGQIFCAGTTTLHAQKEWMRFSCYLRKATDFELPRHIQFIWRDRGFSIPPPQTSSNQPEDEERGIVIDTEYTGSGGVVYDGKTWGIFTTWNMTSGSDYGIDTEDVRMADGTTETLLRFWFTFHETNPLRIGDATNILIRPSYFGQYADPAESLSTTIGKGVAMFMVYHEVRDDPLLGPPPQFFPRPANAWEPIGGAVVPSASGAKTRHTVTIA